MRALLYVLPVGLLLLSGCGLGARVKALGAADAANKRACNSAHASHIQALDAVTQMEAALATAKDALAANSSNGRRPKPAAKAALYDQALSNKNACEQRLSAARVLEKAAADAEQTICTAD